MDFSWDSRDIARQRKATELKFRLDQSGYRPLPCRGRRSAVNSDSSTPHPKKAKASTGSAGPAADVSPPKKNSAAATATNLNRLDESIRVGSDCSGLGAELFALKLLGLEHRIEHVFASEVDSRTRAVYLANHPTVNRMYASCTLKDRRVGGVPKVDHYVAGPPCQPYSLSGKRGGLQDAGTKESGNSNRGLVLLDVVGYIINRRPKTFIIEEVQGLIVGDAKPVFENAISMLRGISVRSTRLYHVEYKLVNSLSLGGVPHNRPRIYIVGMWRSLAKEPHSFKFQWPEPVKAPKLSHFLKPNRAPEWMPTSETQLRSLIRLWGAVKKNEKEDPASVMYMLDISASEEFSSYMKEQCPTLTRNRAGSGGFYLSAWKRMLTTNEISKLQGFPLSTVRAPATDRQFKMMLGNAMTVPVLARLQHMVLASAGFIDEREIPDPVVSLSS